MSEMPPAVPIETPATEAQSLWMNPLAPELRQPDPVHEVAQRNAWLESVLNNDPNRPLPAVTLVVEEQKPKHVVSFDGIEPTHNAEIPAPPKQPGTSITNYGIISGDGVKAGSIQLATPVFDNNSTASKPYINNIVVYDGNGVDFESQRNKGFGPAAYLALLKSLPAGEGLRTAGPLREGSLKRWKWLTDRGVAKQLPLDPEKGYEEFETVF